jgi:hypothetical protein
LVIFRANISKEIHRPRLNGEDMEIVRKLADFAGRLDDAGLSYMADDVDGIATALVKTAQYVGSQGYWIRNQRCWSNCYRQKRASNPSMPAQKVWFACQAEYEKALNESGTSWDKYAGSEQVIKTASFNRQNNVFVKGLNAKLAAGHDLPTAVFSTIEEQIEQPIQDGVKLAAGLLHISQRLALAGNDQLARESADMSDELVRLAGFWDTMRGMGGAAARGIGNAARVSVYCNAAMVYVNYNAQGVAGRSGDALMKAYEALNKATQGYEQALLQSRSEIQGLQNSKNPQVQQRARAAYQLLSKLKAYQIPTNQIQTTVTQLNQAMRGLAPAASTPAAAPPTSAAPAPGGPAGSPASAPPAAASYSGSGSTRARRCSDDLYAARPRNTAAVSGGCDPWRGPRCGPCRSRPASSAPGAAPGGTTPLWQLKSYPDALGNQPAPAAAPAAAQAPAPAAEPEMGNMGGSSFDRGGFGTQQGPTPSFDSGMSSTTPFFDLNKYRRPRAKATRPAPAAAVPPPAPPQVPPAPIAPAAPAAPAPAPAVAPQQAALQGGRRKRFNPAAAGKGAAAKNEGISKQGSNNTRRLY